MRWRLTFLRAAPTTTGMMIISPGNISPASGGQPKGPELAENPRHEHFRQCIATDLCRRDACHQACGEDAACRGHGGTKLMQNQRFPARVAELQEACTRGTALALQAAHRFLYSIVTEKTQKRVKTSPSHWGTHAKRSAVAAVQRPRCSRIHNFLTRNTTDGNCPRDGLNIGFPQP